MLLNKKILITIIILTISIIFIKKPKPMPQTINSQTKGTASSIKIQEISADNSKGFFLTAQTMQLEKNSISKDLFCQYTTCTIISKNEEIAHIKSKTTIMNTKTKDLQLPDKVTGDFNSFKFKGKNFNYNHHQQTIATDNCTMVTHPKIQISSNSAKLNLQNKTIELNGNINSNFTIYD